MSSERKLKSHFAVKIKFCGLPNLASNFDVHESVRRDTLMKMTNKMHYID
jgi:hypothetical protein